MRKLFANPIFPNACMKNNMKMILAISFFVGKGKSLNCTLQISSVYKWLTMILYCYISLSLRDLLIMYETLILFIAFSLSFTFSIFFTLALLPLFLICAFISKKLLILQKKIMKKTWHISKKILKFILGIVLLILTYFVTVIVVNSKADYQPNVFDTIAKDIYKVPLENDIHLLLLVYNSKKLQTQKLKNAISDFNLANFPNDKLTINTLFISDVRIMLTVSYFKEKKLGMEYFQLIRSNKGIAELLTMGESSISIISSINYPIFYKNKNEKEYMDFFSKNYSTQP